MEVSASAGRESRRSEAHQTAFNSCARISPAGNRPLQEPAEDIPFGKWMEDPANQDMFIGYIKEIVKYQLDNVSILASEVGNL